MFRENTACFVRSRTISLSTGIAWVIVGGESGPGARPMEREWVVSIRRQCRDQRVPFFFKQWGGVRKKQNGRLLDNRTYDEYPNRVARPIPERAECVAAAEEFRKEFVGEAA
jgi:protein gp37